MDNFFIKPASEGLIVRDPVSREPLSPQGERKPRNKYWNARKRDGSVVEAEAPAPAPKKGASKGAES